MVKVKNGHLDTESPFPSCTIARGMTPLQKEILAEHIIRHYMLLMLRTITTEKENDLAHDESLPYKRALEHAGVHIHLVENI